MTEDDIPGWFDDDFRSLYQDQVDAAKPGAVFVEIGCWKGKSTAGMARMIQASGKRITFHAVDHFKGSPGDDESFSGCGACEAASYTEFRANLEACGVYGLVTPWEMDSLSVAAMAQDNLADFVFIDGDHRKEAVLADCRAWWPKVKPGGTLAGHDRGLPGVDAAVRQFAEENQLRVTERPSCWVIKKG